MYEIVSRLAVLGGKVEKTRVRCQIERFFAKPEEGFVHGYMVSNLSWVDLAWVGFVRRPYQNRPKSTAQRTFERLDSDDVWGWGQNGLIGARFDLGVEKNHQPVAWERDPLVRVPHREASIGQRCEPAALATVEARIRPYREGGVEVTPPSAGRAQQTRLLHVTHVDHAKTWEPQHVDVFRPHLVAQ